MISRTYLHAAIRVSVLAVALIPFSPASAVGKEERCSRVGTIFILGNTITLDSAILRHVPLKPGDKFTDADLRKVQRNLARLRIFKDDPPPIVCVLDRDDEEVFKDICIEVCERDCNAYFWAVQESLTFANAWARWGLQMAVLRSEEGTFPHELIRFALSGGKADCPFAIWYFLSR